MSSIGDRLREERKRLNLSQEACGIACGVTKMSQLNYEGNKRSPDAAYLQAFANLGGDVQFVLTGVPSVAQGISLAQVERAAEQAYQMVLGSGIQASSKQFSRMVLALLLPDEPGSGEKARRIANVTAGHGSLVAQGDGIVQVGGKVRISRNR